MPDQGRAELPEGATELPPPDVLLFPGPKVPITTYVDSFGWRCCLCGWLGTGHTSREAAQQEAWRHMKSDHPDMERVNVQWLDR